MRGTDRAVLPGHYAGSGSSGHCLQCVVARSIVGPFVLDTGTIPRLRENSCQDVDVRLLLARVVIVARSF